MDAGGGAPPGVRCHWCGGIKLRQVLPWVSTSPRVVFSSGATGPRHTGVALHHTPVVRVPPPPVFLLSTLPSQIAKPSPISRCRCSTPTSHPRALGSQPCITLRAHHLCAISQVGDNGEYVGPEPRCLVLEGADRLGQNRGSGAAPTTTHQN